MRNWAGNYAFTAPDFVEATSIAEVQELVRRGGRVRALGTRHSFNDLADTDGSQVSVTAVDPDFDYDEATGELTVGAGARYAEVARYAGGIGRALHNMGSLPHISVGGAISTATHGSGVTNGNLATAVRGLTFVDAQGDLVEVRQGDPDFAGSVVALGALGVLVRVTLATEPTYLIRQDVYENLPWDALLGDPLAVLGSAYSVSVFTSWAGPLVEQVWLKRRMADAEQPIDDDLLGAARLVDPTARIISEADNTTPLGVTLPWFETLPHFRVDSTPSNGDEIQTEYFVPIEHAGAALAAVRAFADELAPVLLITELRTIAADDLWLSTASGRDSLAIHFTFRKDPDRVLALLPHLEAALAPFEPRPHWGKVRTMDPVAVAASYPRMPDMLALIARRDPDGVFGGPFLDHALGRSVTSNPTERNAE
jgi:alditol oxidase